ncbi:MAG: hypothetical protein L3J07_03680 [Candidatus Magasanikbacteria bacterium]|nr:hypothetical protein [Candidatus Magasanikbacteria bacterium]
MEKESKIMSMSEVAKEIAKEDNMTETEKALAETMIAGKQSAEEQKQEKKMKKEEIEMVKKSEVQRADYLQAAQKANNQPPTENAGVNEAINIRNAYNASANVEDPKVEIERMQKQQEMLKEIKLEEQKAELQKTIQSGEAELDVASKPETDEEKIIISPDFQQEIKNEKRKDVIEALNEAQKAGKESIKADEEKEKNTSLEELTKQATAEQESKKVEDTIPPTTESAIKTEPPEKLSDILKEGEEKEQIGTEITPEWQELEKELDSAPTKEELEVLPEITELEPLPTKGMGEMIKDTPMDPDTKEWLLAQRGLLKKVNDTEGSEKQKRELLLEELTAKLEEKEAKLKKTWFFGKSALKKDIKRLNEIINDSTLFKTGEATKPRNSSRMNRGSENSSGFASKV